MPGILEELKSNIISSWDFRLGHLDDLGSAGNDLSFYGTPKFVGDEGIHCPLSTRVNRNHADCNDIDFTTENFSMEFYFRASNFIDSDLLNMQQAWTGGYLIQFCGDGASRRIYIYDHAYNAVHSNALHDKNQMMHLIITKSGTTWKIYVDGTDETAEDGIDHLSAGSQQLRVANQARQNIAYIKIYDKVLSDVEITSLYEYSQQEFGITETKRNFYYGPNVDNRDSSLIYGTNMEIGPDGKLVDVTGQYPGTIFDATIIDSAFGQGLEFHSTESYVRLVGSQGAIGTGDITFVCLSKPRGAGEIFSNGKFRISVTLTDRIYVKSDGSTAGYTLHYCKWCNFTKLHHLVVVRTSAGIVTIYVDGVDITDVADSGTPVVGAFDATIGNYAYNGNDSGKPYVDNLRVYNGLKDATWVAADYAKFAQQLSFRDSLIDAHVSSVNQTAGQLESTEWQINSGSWQVTRENNEKRIKCVGNGVIYQPMTQAYGTWEFDFNKASESGGSEVIFVGSVVGGRTASGQNGYSVLISATEELYLLKQTDGADAVVGVYTDPSYFTNDTWYRYKVTRTNSGSFYAYTSTDEGLTWNLFEPGVGSWPGVENTFTTSKYLCIKMNTDDEIKNFKFSRGVV